MLFQNAGATTIRQSRTSTTICCHRVTFWLLTLTYPSFPRRSECTHQRFLWPPLRTSFQRLAPRPSGHQTLKASRSSSPKRFRATPSKHVPPLTPRHLPSSEPRRAVGGSILVVTRTRRALPLLTLKPPPKEVLFSWILPRIVV